MRDGGGCDPPQHSAPTVARSVVRRPRTGPAQRKATGVLLNTTLTMSWRTRRWTSCGEASRIEDHGCVAKGAEGNPTSAIGKVKPYIAVEG